MRIVGLLLVAATLHAAACTATTSPDAQCFAAGGLCFIASDTVAGACGSPLSAPCSAGYTCCSEINATNVKDGAAFDSAPFPVPTDAALDAPDGSADASKTDAASSDAAKTDAPQTDAAKSDATSADAGKTDATKS